MIDQPDLTNVNDNTPSVDPTTLNGTPAITYKTKRETDSRGNKWTYQVDATTGEPITYPDGTIKRKLVRLYCGCEPGTPSPDCTSDAHAARRLVARMQ